MAFQTVLQTFDRTRSLIATWRRGGARSEGWGQEDLVVDMARNGILEGHFPDEYAEGGDVPKVIKHVLKVYRRFVAGGAKLPYSVRS